MTKDYWVSSAINFVDGGDASVSIWGTVLLDGAFLPGYTSAKWMNVSTKSGSGAGSVIIEHPILSLSDGTHSVCWGAGIRAGGNTGVTGGSSILPHSRLTVRDL